MPASNKVKKEAAIKITLVARLYDKTFLRYRRALVENLMVGHDGADWVSLMRSQTMREDTGLD